MPKGQKNELTVKQQRFVDFYDGNATEAAAQAGYKGNRKVLESMGRKLLANGRIRSVIQNREKKTLQNI